MKEKAIIEAAREGFDGRLHSDNYRTIHSDSEQLEGLLAMLEIREVESYLDIGTGNGYVAFALARAQPGLIVRGLDIALKSIEKNNEIAKAEGIPNLEFVSYEGFDLPFADESFFGSVSRYALHHFPDIRASLAELRRVTKDGGFFVLSDPLTRDDDETGFVDRFQSLLPDGHVHFYKRAEIEALFAEFGFVVEKEFSSSVRYPRAMDDRYRALIGGADKKALEGYRVELEVDQVFITVEVMNLFFRKKPR